MEAFLSVYEVSMNDVCMLRSFLFLPEFGEQFNARRQVACADTADEIRNLFPQHDVMAFLWVNSRGAAPGRPFLSLIHCLLVAAGIPGGRLIALALDFKQNVVKHLIERAGIIPSSSAGDFSAGPIGTSAGYHDNIVVASSSSCDLAFLSHFILLVFCAENCSRLCSYYTHIYYICQDFGATNFIVEIQALEKAYINQIALQRRRFLLFLIAIYGRVTQEIEYNAIYGSRNVEKCAKQANGIYIHIKINALESFVVRLLPAQILKSSGLNNDTARKQ
jgi:hypothetical protein